MEGKKSITPYFYSILYTVPFYLPHLSTLINWQKLSGLGFNNLCPLVRGLEQFISTSDALLLELGYDHLRDMFKIVGCQCQYCRSRTGEADSQEARVGLRSHRGEDFWESGDLAGGHQ